MSSRQPRTAAGAGQSRAASSSQPQPRRSGSAGAQSGNKGNSGQHQQQPQRSASASAASANTHVADVNPTYTIRGSVRCAETINDRIAWTAECDGSLKIRSLPKGTELKVIPGRPRTHCSTLLYVEPQQQLWAAFEDGHVRVYSVLQSELEKEFVATQKPGAAVTAMLEVEGIVFVSSSDGHITQYDCQSFTRLRTLPGHVSAVRCLGCYMGPTGSIVFSGGDDGTTKAWDPYMNDDVNASSGSGEGAACLFTFSGHSKGAVRAIEVVNYANQLWTAGDDATVRVWNLETLACAAVLHGHAAPVTSLLCIESRMWSGDSAGRVVLWDINSCTQLQELSARLPSTAAGGGGILTMKKMQPSTSWKVWTASAKGVVQCWNAETVPILFKAKGKKTAAKAAGNSTTLQTQRRGSTLPTDIDGDEEEVQAWRLFQKTIMDQLAVQEQQANPDGRRPSLGIVDIQRLADELGYERGRMEVQRELQTQQLLEEENAQLKNKLKALTHQHQQQQEELAQARQSADGAAQGKPKGSSAAGASSPQSGQETVAAAQQQRDRLAEEVRHLREENEALQRIVKKEEGKTPDPAVEKPAGQYDELIAIKDAELRRLQDQLAAERDSTEYMKAVVGEKERQRESLERQLAELKNHTTPLRQPQQQQQQQSSVRAGRTQSSIPSVSEDRPSVELSPSPPPIDRTNLKAARPSSLLGTNNTTVDGPEYDGFRSPSQDGAGAAAAAPPQRPPIPPSGASDEELRRLRADYAKLKEDHDALDAYLQTRLKPLIADLKRARGELGLDVARLEKENAELQERLAAQAPPPPSVMAAGAAVDVSSSGDPFHTAAGANDDVESLTHSQTPSTADDTAYLRRELRKAQADAAAKGTALRKVQRELDVVKRAMGSGGTPPPSANTRATSVETSTSATIDAAMEKELAAKDSELQQLRRDYEQLNQHVNQELKPTVAELKRAVADRDAQLRVCTQEINALRNNLEATASDGEENRVRSVKMSEAVEALRAEIENERHLRSDLQQQLEKEKAKAKNAALGTRPSPANANANAPASNGKKSSSSPESSVVGRGTQPTFMDDGADGTQGLEAQNLALSVRLADAEVVIAELQANLEKTALHLEAQRRETDRLMNLIVDLQEGGEEL